MLVGEGAIEMKARPMRIIHTSDWHLGQEIHGFDRGVEHDAFLDWLAGQLIELDADVLIVTGDVYDTVNPPIPAQQRLYQFLRRALTERPHIQIPSLNRDSSSSIERPPETMRCCVAEFQDTCSKVASVACLSGSACLTWVQFSGGYVS